MNKKIYLKIFLYLIFLVFVLGQISFLNNATFFAQYLNFTLILLFLLLFIWTPLDLLLYLLTAAFIFDLYSQFSFGVYLLTFTITFAVLYILLKNILTHYSVITALSILIIGTFLFNLLLFLITKILFLINLNNYYFTFNFKAFFGQLLMNILFISVTSRIFKLIRKKILFRYER